MKLNLTTPIKDYKNTVILDEKEQPVTLRALIDSAISINIPNEQPTSDQKAKIFQIGVKLWSGPEVEFTVDQLALIKELAGKSLNSLAYGRLCELIEGSGDQSEAS